MWSKVVTRRVTASIWRQWQQAYGLESISAVGASLAFHISQGSSKSTCLVTPSERFIGFWWWNCRSLHQVLEHDVGSRATVDSDGVSGLQLNVQPKFVGVGEHPRVQWECCVYLEISFNAQNIDFDRSQFKSALPGNVSRWRVDRDGCRWWNSEILESVPKTKENRKNKVINPRQRLCDQMMITR